MRTSKRWCWLALAAACAAPQPRWATEEDIERMEPAARAGDRAAIRALFDCNADGAVAESIDIVLGATIRVVPRVFLEELVRNAQRRGCSFAEELWLGGLVGNFGPELHDDLAAQAAEAKGRIAALRDRR